MTTKHTPGPQGSYTLGDGHYSKIDRLHAAAPDMLEALKSALERLEASHPSGGSATEKVCNHVRAAIAKAEWEDK